MIGKIVDRKEISESTLYVRLALDEDILFKAGQFFKLTLSNPPYSDEKGNSRFLGFINSPSQNRIVETVMRLRGSAFKRYLQEAPEGTEVEIGGIDGEMTLPEDPGTPWVIVTGGIGIVPYMSMFRVIKEQNLSHKVTLFYSNTNQARAIFMDELYWYVQENPNFNFIPTMTQDDSWQGERRRIDENYLREKIPNPQGSLIYISGTPRFVPDMVRYVKLLGATQNKVKFEVFTGY